mgnify:CR=1 FL=1
MTLKDKIAFIDKRIDTKINGTSNSEIMNWVNNCTIDRIEGYDCIDDGAHGYLIIPVSDKNYELAKRYESQYSKRYRMNNGAILLEEDCDATQFLQAIKN